MKLLKLVAAALASFVVAVTINILLHEVGHFVVADTYGYEPAMHFMERPKGDVFATSAAVAYVSYNGNSRYTTYEDALIAFAGPLFNLMLCLFGALIFAFYGRKNVYIDAILLVFILISLTACISNLIPFAPSDGYIILRAFG